MTPSDLDRFIAEEPLFAQSKMFARIVDIIHFNRPIVEQVDWIKLARRELSTKGRFPAP